MSKKIGSQTISTLIYHLIFLGLGLAPAIIMPQPSLSAEKIRFIYGPFHCSLSVDSLETYAQTGQITPEFRFYTQFFDSKTLTQLRHWLQKRFYSNQIELYHYTRTPEGEQLLQQLGTVFKTHSARNGFYALRASLLKASSNDQGWTILDVIHQFPTEQIQINTEDLFKIPKFWSEPAPLANHQL